MSKKRRGATGVACPKRRHVSEKGRGGRHVSKRNRGWEYKASRVQNKRVVGAKGVAWGAGAKGVVCPKTASGGRHPEQAGGESKGHRVSKKGAACPKRRKGWASHHPEKTEGGQKRKHGVGVACPRKGAGQGRESLRGKEHHRAVKNWVRGKDEGGNVSLCYWIDIAVLTE